MKKTGSRRKPANLRLRAAIMDKGHSVGQAAERTAIAMTTLSSILTGRLRPNDAQRAAILRVYRVPIKAWQ